MVARLSSFARKQAPCAGRTGFAQDSSLDEAYPELKGAATISAIDHPWYPRKLPTQRRGATESGGKLSYDQLASWASAIQEKTGKRLLGFPAGPQGLMHRFFEGFLYPSYTGGVVVPFRSEAAEAMWTYFASLWKSVNPNSTSYNFLQEPLLSGDVWIGFDHIVDCGSRRFSPTPI